MEEVEKEIGLGLVGRPKQKNIAKLRKKFVLMSRKIPVDHLAFVIGAKDLLVVKLLKSWMPKTEVSDLVHHHHQHHHHHPCSLVWQQKQHKKK